MLLELLGVFLSLGIYLAIAIPIAGALVRLRANFNPKSIQLDAEGNVEPHTGPIVTSFFGMLKRVKRIEVCASPASTAELWVADVVLCRAGADCTKALVRPAEQLYERKLH